METFIAYLLLRYGLAHQTEDDDEQQGEHVEERREVQEVEVLHDVRPPILLAARRHAEREVEDGPNHPDQEPRTLTPRMHPIFFFFNEEQVFWVCIFDLRFEIISFEGSFSRTLHIRAKILPTPLRLSHYFSPHIYWWKVFFRSFRILGLHLLFIISSIPSIFFFSFPFLVFFSKTFPCLLFS